MHICYLTNEYPKPGFPHGGIGSFVKTIAISLVKEGYKVSIIGVNYSGEDEETLEEGVKIYRLKKINKRGLTWFFNSKTINNKIKAIHKLQPIHIVETSELGLAFIQKEKQIKYVIRLHGGHHFFSESENRKINAWKGLQEKISFRKADAFVAVSKYVKTHTEKYLSYHNKKVELINYPINTNLFKPIDYRVVENQIAFAGTVCKKKGVLELIRAFVIVRKEFPKATLVLYGRDWFFPDGTSYIEMLKKNELADLGSLSQSIAFFGPVDYESIPMKYAQAEVCVFPSHMETQGLVAPEAMAMGKMVIFTKLGPGKETIEDYKTGLLCDPHSPEDIAQKIIWVFENNLKSLEIGSKARDFVMRKYGLETTIKENKIFYKSILDQ